MVALAQKPTLSPARFCLGLTITASSAGHAKPLLAQGLVQYLIMIQESHETQAEPERATPSELNSKIFYRRSNTLLVKKSYVIFCYAVIPLDTLYFCYYFLIYRRMDSLSFIGLVDMLT